MVQEVGRRLVGGVWVTNVEDEGGGGGSVDAVDVSVSPTVAGESNVQDALEALESGGSQPGAAVWAGPMKINTFAGQAFDGSDGGDADGGTWTATINGETTAPIAWNATEAEWIAALEALPSIGEGGIVYTEGDWFDINYSSKFAFGGLLATELMTVDASGLTGPSAPYTVAVTGAGIWPQPLFTLQEGDLLEDFFYWLETPFDNTNTPRFVFTDRATAGSPSGNATWFTPRDSGGGQMGFVIGTDADTEPSTNFMSRGGFPEQPNTRPSALQASIGAWVAAPDTWSIELPAVATNEVTVNAMFGVVGSIATPPSQGEVWIWWKVASGVAAP